MKQYLLHCIYDTGGFEIKSNLVVKIKRLFIIVISYKIYVMIWSIYDI